MILCQPRRSVQKCKEVTYCECSQAVVENSMVQWQLAEQGFYFHLAACDQGGLDRGLEYSRQFRSLVKDSVILTG